VCGWWPTSEGDCHAPVQARTAGASVVLVSCPYPVANSPYSYQFSVCPYPRPFLSDSSSVTVVEQLISEVTVASHPIVIQTLVQMSRPSSRLFH